MQLTSNERAAFHRLFLAAMDQPKPSKRLVKALNYLLDTTHHVLSTKRSNERLEDANA